jgi:sodium transport system permease protein
MEETRRKSRIQFLLTKFDMQSFAGVRTDKLPTGMMGTIPLDAHTLTPIGVTLIPLAMFAASLMFAIALFARSYKGGQSYLTPLALVVIFPALMGGMSDLEMTPALCLVPIFNASQMIRGILLGDATIANFAITTVANLAYAAIAFVIATRQFENENVLFRS